jgi:hypothetical protein
MPHAHLRLSLIVSSALVFTLLTVTPVLAQDGPQAGPPSGAAQDDGGMPPPLGPDGKPMAGPPGGFKAETPEHVGVWIKDGHYDAADSTPSAVTGGKIGDMAASGLNITSTTERFNALYVSGPASNFTLSNSSIRLSGRGGDDVSGIGAGVLVGDGGVLTLRNVHIETSAAVASAAVSTGKGTLRVFDSTLISHGGPLPEGYKPHIGPGMMEAPPPLKITGTARAANTTFGASSYYYNTRIVSDGWGAFSTDGGGKYAECNHCYLETIKSGYGAYADNGIEVTINDSQIHTATYTAIIAGTGKMTLNNDVAVSKGEGVMIHDVMGRPTEVGVLNLHGGSLTGAKDAILVKSANAAITIDRAALSSATGVLIHAVVNDDANATKATKDSPGTRVIILLSALKGDLINDDQQRMMDANLIDTRLTGRIHHIAVALSGKSLWMATKASDVMLIGATDVTRIDAPKGVKIEAIAGDGTTLKGSYRLKSGGSLIMVAMPPMPANGPAQ